MNFYAERPDAFDENDLAVAAIFAPFAALALQSALYRQESAHLHTALDSASMPGSAVPVPMVW
jgi:GAF domain-containing protein